MGSLLKKNKYKKFYCWQKENFVLAEDPPGEGARKFAWVESGK